MHRQFRWAKVLDRSRKQPAAGPPFWRWDGDAPLVIGGCVAAVVACLALVGLGSNAYQTVLGITHPAAPTLGIVLFGLAGWLLLVREGWIPGRVAGSQGIRLAVLSGLALPLPVIAVDWLGGFGPDINAAAPDSLLFYPSIAVVAELALHIGPLAITALIATVLQRGESVLEALGLLVAATTEPILQVLWSAPDSPAWATAYVGLQLLVFNILGLFLLRRFGLIRVLIYRGSYYLVWHIVWGHARLGLLYSG
jgi:hypothetical protein